MRGAPRCFDNGTGVDACYTSFLSRHRGLSGVTEGVAEKQAAMSPAMHGSKRREDAPADIYIGSENGCTITALREGTSDDVLYRRRGLVGLLQAADYPDAAEQVP